MTGKTNAGAGGTVLTAEGVFTGNATRTIGIGFKPDMIFIRSNRDTDMKDYGFGAWFGEYTRINGKIKISSTAGLEYSMWVTQGSTGFSVNIPTGIEFYYYAVKYTE